MATLVQKLSSGTCEECQSLAEADPVYGFENKGNVINFAPAAPTLAVAPPVQSQTLQA